MREIQTSKAGDRMNKWVHRIVLVLGFLPLLGIGAMSVFLMVMGDVLDSITMEKETDKDG